MLYNLVEIAKGRAKNFIRPIAKVYKETGLLGCAMIGMSFKPWLRSADSALNKTILNCIKPYCQHCRRIVSCRTIMRDDKTHFNVCVDCDEIVEWVSYHGADQAEAIFWQTVEETLSEMGLVLHGCESDENIYYICDGINCETYPIADDKFTDL